MDGQLVLPPQISSEVLIFSFPLDDSHSIICFSLNSYGFTNIYANTGDGVVVKGRAYGIRSIRVDGNDALAMYSAVHAAREMVIIEQRPILIEVTMM